MQTISPPATSRSRSSTASVPLGLATETPSSTSRGLPDGEAGSLSTTSWTARPTISSARSDSESVGFAVPTTLPCRITVILSAIARTSRSLWVMKTIALPSSRSERMTAISSSISCGVSTAVGSSKIRYLASLAKRLQDLDPLLHTDRKVLDHRVRVHIQSVAFREASHGAPSLIHVEQAGLALLPAQNEVLGDRENLDQHEVLVHHADAGSNRLLGIGGYMLDTVDRDRALVGLVAARRARSSAWTCRRRSPQAGSGFRRARCPGRSSRWRPGRRTAW